MIIAGIGAGSGVLAHGGDDDDDVDDDDHSGPGRGGGDDHDDRDDDHHGLPPEQSTQVTGATSVRIVDERYEPNNILIETGQTVTWVNQDDDQHTASGRGMDTGVIDPGDEATVTFLEPGEFHYSCNFHPEMLGLVTVTGESKATPQASPAASPIAAPMEVGIEIVDFAFEPKTTSVALGGAVTWTNAGQTPHSILADWASSDVLNPGDTFEHRFDEAGTFEYQCGLHPSMVGTIAVVHGPEATPDPSPFAEGAGDWMVEFAFDNPSVLPFRRARLSVAPDGRFTAGPELLGNVRAEYVVALGQWLHLDGKLARIWVVHIAHEYMGVSESDFPHATAAYLMEDVIMNGDDSFTSTVSVSGGRVSGSVFETSGFGQGRRIAG